MMILPSNRNVKTTRIIFHGFALLCLLFIMTTPVTSSASTFLLQLGTFDSQAQATQKWDDIKSKNPDLLGSYTLHIAEISMPPDNKTSYRTQVGPVDSHEKASKICSTLEDKGDECYVVETALMDSDSAPAQAAAPAPTVAVETPAASPIAEAPTPVAPAPVATPIAEPVAQASTNSIVPGREPKFLDDEPTAPSASVAKAESVAAAPVAEPAPAPSAPVFTHISPTPEPIATAPVETPTIAPQPVLAGGYVPGREPKFLDDQPAPAPAAVAQAPVATPTTTESAAASPKEEQKPGFFGRLFGRSTPSTPPAAPANAAVPEGNVAVAEAIPVPLTQGNNTRSATTFVKFQPVHPLGGLPGQNTPNTYWAQLNYFNDEAQAQNFYEEFRNRYPQLTDNVRIRITRPYSYANRPGHVSLRIGPFATANDIRVVCSAAAQKGLRCTSVKDLGISVAAGATRSATSASTSVASSGKSAQVIANGASYWVQLGSYPTSDDAWDKWKSIKGKKRAFAKAKATVTTPQSSSSASPLYRLRVGPYANQEQASSLCNKLMAVGESCIVINEH